MEKWKKMLEKISEAESRKQAGARLVRIKTDYLLPHGACAKPPAGESL